jgi:hypothetical protein
MILARWTPFARSMAMNAIPLSVMVFRSRSAIDSPVSFIVAVCCDDYHRAGKRDQLCSSEGVRFLTKGTARMVPFWDKGLQRPQVVCSSIVTHMSGAGDSAVLGRQERQVINEYQALRRHETWRRGRCDLRIEHHDTKPLRWLGPKCSRWRAPLIAMSEARIASGRASRLDLGQINHHKLDVSGEMIHRIAFCSVYAPVLAVSAPGHRRERSGVHSAGKSLSLTFARGYHDLSKSNSWPRKASIWERPVVSGQVCPGSPGAWPSPRVPPRGPP